MFVFIDIKHMFNFRLVSTTFFKPRLLLTIPDSLLLLVVAHTFSLIIKTCIRIIIEPGTEAIY